jgi:hypothetical protein
MNQHEAKLFNELLEVNWKIGHDDYDIIIKHALTNHYHHLIKQLEDSMGAAEWRKFMNTGREMFAPKDGYGDEDEEIERIYAEI